ncbi:MAG TPA: hypothetical protein VFR09_04300 [Alphaproteobacteria bacterium]|nr:hypothetical protein [Alphaproteobacteria bacterium]
MTIDDIFDRRIPLALGLALFLQASGAVWWAATKDSDDRFQQQRITGLEQALAQTKDGQVQMIERLARIEERMNAEVFILDRIEKQLGASQR